MERLTARSAGIPILDPRCEEKYTRLELIDILVNRLTPYEDLGLEPGVLRKLLESVAAFCKVCEDGKERLRELARADRAGRLFLPPVKVGDKVYSVTYDEVPGEYVIGEPEEIVEVGTKGFFLAWDENPNYPEEFHPYEELGTEFYLSYDEAEAARAKKKEAKENDQR